MNDKNKESGVTRIVLYEDTPHFELFFEWLKDATKNNLRWNAFNLATSSRDGRVSNRTVVAREFHPDGSISFLTQCHSRKAIQIKENDSVAVCFLWIYNKTSNPPVTISRQVRIDGIAEKLPEETTYRYFSDDFLHGKIRNTICQTGNIVSKWEDLKEMHDEVLQRHIEEKMDIEMPSYMESYKISPEMIEFYQDQTGQMADRIRFIKDSKGKWLPWVRVHP